MYTEFLYHFMSSFFSKVDHLIQWKSERGECTILVCVVGSSTGSTLLGQPLQMPSSSLPILLVAIYGRYLLSIFASAFSGYRLLADVITS